MDPSETITAQSTVGAPDVESPEIGVCEGCGEPIYSGLGVVVDKQSNRWHPDCRSVELRKARQTRKAAGAATG